MFLWDIEGECQSSYFMRETVYTQEISDWSGGKRIQVSNLKKNNDIPIILL